MYIPVLYAFNLLCDFEAKGGEYESVEVIKRTKRYTERYCKMCYDNRIAYTVVRVYKNGIACIIPPWIDENEDCIMSREFMPRIKPDEEPEERGPIFTERENYLLKYFGAGVIGFLISVIIVVSMKYGKIDTMEGMIYFGILVGYFVARRFIWYKQIVAMGHEDTNYYEKYK